MRRRQIRLDDSLRNTYIVGAMGTTAQSTFRFSDETLALLAAVAEYHGVSRTAALEMLIREHARAKGLIKKGKA
jgi:hypothetical protein